MWNVEWDTDLDGRRLALESLFEVVDELCHLLVAPHLCVTTTLFIVRTHALYHALHSKCSGATVYSQSSPVIS